MGKAVSDQVEAYLGSVGRWEKELRELARIAREAGLTEEIKWKQPCYTYKGKNIVILGALKDYCLMSFFKGVLLKDPKGLLISLTENVQAERLIRVECMDDIKVIEKDIMAYIQEAIAIEEAGDKVPMKDTCDYNIPKELQEIFNQNQAFMAAFYMLSPGRQRGYLLHYSSAKKSQTRSNRIKKSMERIYMGKGLNDCICGLSKRMPRCDGSHKAIDK